MQIVDTVLDSQGVYCSHLLQFALGILFEVKEVERDFLFVFVEPPDNLGMVVAFLDVVIVGPFVILGLPLGDWL